MKDTKYKSREYQSEAIINKAITDVEVIAYSLLPNRYSIIVKDCDVESENAFTERWKYEAKIVPEHDAPHFHVYSRTRGGVFAKVIELLLSMPIYPIK